MASCDEIFQRLDSLSSFIYRMEQRLSYDFSKLTAAETDVIAKLDTLAKSVGDLTAQLAAVM
jgi:hypothetical protein